MLNDHHIPLVLFNFHLHRKTCASRTVIFFQNKLPGKILSSTIWSVLLTSSSCLKVHLNVCPILRETIDVIQVSLVISAKEFSFSSECLTGLVSQSLIYIIVLVLKVWIHPSDWVLCETWEVLFKTWFCLIFPFGCDGFTMGMSRLMLKSTKSNLNLFPAIIAICEWLQTIFVGISLMGSIQVTLPTLIIMPAVFSDGVSHLYNVRV